MRGCKFYVICKNWRGRTGWFRQDCADRMLYTRQMAGEYSIGVITNDIYTKEDAQFLSKKLVCFRAERITGVETGGCPHTAIREDASMNLEAVDEMMEKFPDIQLLFIESGGDNLSATFSPELVDATDLRH